MSFIFNIILPEVFLDLSKKEKKVNNFHNNDYVVKNITLSQLKTEAEILPVDQSWHKDKYGFSLSQSEIEKFLLHRLAWQYFIQSSDEYCIIVENYPIPLEGAIPELGKSDSIMKDWDVLFPFSGQDVLERKDDLEKTVILNYNLHERKDYEPYLLGRKWGSFFYFLSRHGGVKLIKIKEITQNVDDEILLLSHENKLNVYCQVFPFFKYANRPRILNLDREKEIYSAIMAKNLWKGDVLKTARNLLKTVAAIAKRLNIALLLEGGTLLGHIQYDGLMPWDDDIDLGIYYKDIDKFILMLEEKKRVNIIQMIEERSSKPFYKIWTSNGTPIEGKNYNFPFIDLWLYDIYDKDIVYLNGIVNTNAKEEKFITVDFEGSQFNIPFNAIQYLDDRYKTWRNTIRVYQWSHRHEKNLLYPLTVQIKTDKTGRMVAPLFQLLNR